MKQIIKILLASSTALFITVGCGGGSSLVDYDSISQDDISPAPSNAPKLTDTQKNEYLKAINDARAVARDCGEYGHMDAVPPLKWNDALYKAAYEHTYDMAEQNYLGHTGSGESTDKTGADLNKKSLFYERIAHNGYKYQASGENVAGGYRTTADVMKGWLESPGHCKNIMSPDFTEVGMAFVQKSGTKYTYYWTQDFGTPRQ